MQEKAMRVANWTGVIPSITPNSTLRKSHTLLDSNSAPASYDLPRKSLVVIYRVCLLQQANSSVACDFQASCNLADL